MIFAFAVKYAFQYYLFRYKIQNPLGSYFLLRQLGSVFIWDATVLELVEFALLDRF